MAHVITIVTRRTGHSLITFIILLYIWQSIRGRRQPSLQIFSIHVCKEVTRGAGCVASVGQRGFEGERVHRLLTLQRS